MSDLAFRSEDLEAANLLRGTRPLWTGMQTVRDIVGGEEMTVLHAGPPLSDEALGDGPIVYSAVLALLFEGWAETADEAQRMIKEGLVRLQPSAEHNVVVPLAGVATPSMVVHRVEDSSGKGVPSFAVVNEGQSFGLRFGTRDSRAIERQRWISESLNLWLTEALVEPIDLFEIMEQALVSGDDCHSDTSAGSKMVVDVLRRRGPELSTEVSEFFESAPSFALNLWMAAVACAMSAARGVLGSGFVTRAGGNGHEFGIEVSGLPGRWFTCAAVAPQAPLGEDQGDTAGALGDSALLDLVGFGATTFGRSARLDRALVNLLPENWVEICSMLTSTAHPVFSNDWHFGMSVHRIVDIGVVPRVVLGRIDRGGERGRLGGGIYEPPAELFEEAHVTLGRAL